jgi:hypothetical protein
MESASLKNIRAERDVLAFTLKKLYEEIGHGSSWGHGKMHYYRTMYMQSHEDAHKVS